MFIPRIYYPHPLVLEDSITLSSEKSRYLHQVLRLKNNASLILFNGDGNEYYATITFNKKTACAFIEQVKTPQRESFLALHLVQAITRSDRMDYTIQKATELGVTSITPVISHHCLVKLDAQKVEKRQQHWQNVAISAAEQSGRTQVPILYSPLPFAQVITQSFNGLSVVFDLDGTQRIRNLPVEKNVRLAIGPESGWTIEETKQLITNDFISCGLGTRVLRTETAGVAAISIFQGIFGDI